MYIPDPFIPRNSLSYKDNIYQWHLHVSDLPFLCVSRWWLWLSPVGFYPHLLFRLLYNYFNDNLCICIIAVRFKQSMTAHVLVLHAIICSNVCYTTVYFIYLSALIKCPFQQQSCVDSFLFNFFTVI